MRNLSFTDRGLSPPTRGNLLFRRHVVLLFGSIPAHAGEPPLSRISFERRPVYPRPRGGTRAPRHSLQPGGGLSPPTRGNLEPLPTRDKSARSIPAHAGEPVGRLRARSPAPVYPRPRGGTPCAHSPPALSGGLSPPTRGNPTAPDCARLRLRSIPAHAGEPARLPLRPTAPAVYPRPRGGTPHATEIDDDDIGLSPPTRGNRLAAAVAAYGARSIPAHAGEPAKRPIRAFEPKVYPRPRGGTSA